MAKLRLIFTFILIFTVYIPEIGHNIVSGGDLNNSNLNLQILRSDERGMILEYIVQEYQITDELVNSDTYQKLAVNGLNFTNKQGWPQLPIFSVVIGIPIQGEINLQIIEDKNSYLPGTYNILPVGQPSPISQDDQIAQEEVRSDPNAYQSQEFYPLEVIQQEGEAWMRDQRIARIEFHPFQYNAAQGTILWHQRIRVEVQYPLDKNSSQESERNNYPGNPNPYETVLRGILLNYEVAKNWRGYPQVSGGVPTSMDGPRYKIEVDQDGLYSLTYDDLLAAGMDVDNVDPRTFYMSNQGEDVSIYVAGEEDGHLDQGDYILFYGQKFRGDRLAAMHSLENTNYLTYTEQLSTGLTTLWHPQFNTIQVEKYTNDNVYWLQEGIATNPPRMAEIDGTPGSAQVPTTFRTTVHAEKSMRKWDYHFTSEDNWFWEPIYDTGIRTYTTTLTGVSTLPFTATIKASVVAYNYNDQSGPDHHTKYWINSLEDPIDEAYWEGMSRYTFKTDIPGSVLLEGENQLKFQILDDTICPPSVWFDWFEISYDKKFIASQNTLQFTGENGGQWKYQVEGFTSSDVTVYEITDPLNPKRILNPLVEPFGGGYQASFETQHEPGVQYYMVGQPAIRTPKSLAFYDPPDLRSADIGADYIIISHPDFLGAAQKLADFRRTQGLRSLVVSLDDVINEFNEGIYHPIAIKNFLEYTFNHWQPPAPSYVILVGDGTYNLKGYNPGYYPDLPIFMPPNLSWVDPWQGEVDSSNLLANVVGLDPIPDVMISRIPINSEGELMAVIDKTISFELAPRADWQYINTFVADNTPDPAGDFVQMAESIIDYTIKPGYTPIRIYEDNYMDYGLCGTAPYPGGPSCPNVNRAITETVSYTGTQFLNYIGHASLDRWSNEQVMLYHADDPSNPYDRYYNDIGTMLNDNQYFVVLSLTCLDGYWFHPIVQPSLAEVFTRTPGKGAVAAFSPSGFGVSAGHDSIHRGFYDSIFYQGNWVLGPATVESRLMVYATGVNYDLINTYGLFGDPALDLKSPYSLDLSPESESQSGMAGTSVSYTLQLTNTSTITDSYEITATGNVWTTTLPFTSTTLLPIQTISIPIQVQIPSDVPGGAIDNMNLQVVSLGDRSQRGNTTLVTTANVYGLQLKPSYDSKVDLPGSTVTYTLQLTNTSNISDTFNINTGSHLWPTTPSSGVIGPLDSGQGEEFYVAVDIPDDTPDRSEDTAVITATSMNDPQREAISTLYTTARTFSLTLNPPFKYGSGRAGETVSYSMTLKNTGGYPDTIDLSALSINGWPVTLDRYTIGPLEPEAETVFTATVQIPIDVSGDYDDTTWITATSQGDTSYTSTTTLYTTAQVYGLDLTTSFDQRSELAGATIAYTLTLTNLGNMNDVFNVSAGDHLWNTTVSPTQLQLISGDKGVIMVLVQVPQGAADGEQDSITITVTSSMDPNKYKSITLTSTAMQLPQVKYFTFIPDLYK